MAFYSGQAASYNELLNVLVNACSANGWSWSDGILSKGNAFVKPYVSTSLTVTLGPGLVIQGGTGKSGNTLLNPSRMQPRIGAIGAAPVILPSPVFPLLYRIFIFNNPDEVYLVIKYDNDRFANLAFGASNIDGVKGWISASLSAGYFTQTSDQNYKSFSITPTTGGNNGNSGTASQTIATGFFWQNDRLGYDHHITSAVYVDLGDIKAWMPDNSTSGCEAVSAIDPLISRLPSTWSSTSNLLPVQIYCRRDSNKKSLVAELAHVRFLRIDNYEPEQIISLGSERWMILPFCRKNLSARNGGMYIDHSGTLGWAIRYDGP